MRQAIVHNKGRFCSEENFNNFMVDTKMLSGIPSEEQFLAALDLFKLFKPKVAEKRKANASVMVPSILVFGIKAELVCVLHFSGSPEHKQLFRE